MSYSMVLPKPLNGDSNNKLMELKELGDVDARNDLIEGNMRLVSYISNQFQNTGIPVDDIISTGAVGLIKAVDSFKLDKEIKFATYASMCIRNEILMSLRKVKKHKYTDSLDVEVGINDGGNKMTLLDVLPDSGIDDFSEAVIESETLSEVRDIISTFSPIEQRILDLKFFQNKTQYDIGVELGFAQSYISRLARKAIVKIRVESERRALMPKDKPPIKTKKTKKAKKTKKVGVKMKMNPSNRAEAIRLLEETELSYRVISERTGVPSGSLGKLALEHRPLDTRNKMTAKAKSGLSGSHEADVEDLKTKAMESVKQMILESSCSTPESAPVVAQESVVEEVTSSVPAYGIIQSRMSSVFDVDGENVKSEDFIKEVLSVLTIIENSKNDKVTFSLSVRSY